MDQRVRIAVYGLVLLIAALPRVVDLGAILSPDEPRWEHNTQGFLEGLKTGEMKLLYQQPHPGITTQWLSAATINSPSWAIKRLPIALFVSVSIMLTAYLLNRLWGEPYGYVAGLLLSLDPLFIAHSRVLAMDALLGVFLLISLISLLLWHKEQWRWWLVISGISASLALLSKMSGALIVPFAVAFIVLVSWRYRRPLSTTIQSIAGWLAAAALTMVIVLPTILTNFDVVWQGTQTFFFTEHFQQAVHALGPWWYPEALLIWSTPLTLLALFAAPLLIVRDKRKRFSIITSLIFAGLFFLAMQYSIKKGDRYLLPLFLVWDIIAAAGITWLASSAWRTKKIGHSIAAVILGAALLWQGYEIIDLHPHALAYRNPWFSSQAVGRTMGWGEGLDVAAAYLKSKPNASELFVISYYESSLMHRFPGKVTSAERLARETAEEIGADYVVLYRTMEGRAVDRWETKVLTDYADKKPEHVIELNGEPYVWIYPVRDKVLPAPSALDL